MIKYKSKHHEKNKQEIIDCYLIVRFLPLTPVVIVKSISIELRD
jgi:hypothetical protein